MATTLTESVKFFNFRTPSWTILIEYVGYGYKFEPLKAKSFYFDDNKDQQYIGFWVNDTALFYFNIDILNEYFQFDEKYDNDYVEIVRQLVYMINPIFANDSVVIDILQKGTAIREAFKDFTNAYNKIIDLYHHLENPNPILSNNFPQEITCSFDELGIFEWEKTTDDVTSLLEKLISYYSLDE